MCPERSGYVVGLDTAEANTVLRSELAELRRATYEGLVDRLFDKAETHERLGQSGTLYQVAVRRGYVGAGVRGLHVVKVQRIGFLGVRTDRVAETTAFFRDVVGLPAVATGEHRTVTQLPTGRWDFVEVFGSDFHDQLMIPPDADGVFVSIFVEDVEEALRDCEAAGIEILGETIWAEQAFGNPEYAGAGWFFVRAPDGNVYVFQQVPD